MKKLTKWDFIFIICSILMVVLKTFYDAIYGTVGVFVYMLAILPIWAICIFGVIISIIFILKKENMRKGILCLLTTALITVIPFCNIYEMIRFNVLKSDMERAAIEIAENYNKADDFDYIRLNDEDMHLTRQGNGKIALRVTKDGIDVGFFAVSDILGASREFIYHTGIKKTSEYYYDYNFDRFSMPKIKEISPKWGYYKFPSY